MPISISHIIVFLILAYSYTVISHLNRHVTLHWKPIPFGYLHVIHIWSAIWRIVKKANQNIASRVSENSLSTLNKRFDQIKAKNNLI